MTMSAAIPWCSQPRSRTPIAQPTIVDKRQWAFSVHSSGFFQLSGLEGW